ncbi:ABC transporter permease [Streptomyces zagrosensis]|uniref:Putative ABC transport system permease protein n=1 Tax=Streptomyces zagrosensis TaxID=1042984 RepID=A0A7W9UYL5_9ACTN|nr:FtsX-like permease family protein [Streptomyces zagrosensis]MBB5934904.1 putative ABC transport system permease protein [Streptomyces zagrosensis]
MTGRRSLSNGLARAAIRFKPAAFAGTFVALMMAPLIVSGCGILLESGIRASAPPQRYADVPVVAAADQRVHVMTGSGKDGEDQDELVPDAARLDAALITKIAKAPGVAAAIPDVSYPVRARTGTVTAGGWGSTAFTGVRLATGTAPRTATEVALDPATAQAQRVKVGDQATVTTADGAHRFRVTGITKPLTRAALDGPTLWFTDQRAIQLSGHPGKIDAVAVLAAPGTATADLADQVKKAVNGKAKVHTGDDRGGVEEPDLAEAKELLIALGGSFGGMATMVAIFTASGTVALCVGQRSREFALLRAIGATPRQLRRSIATEALLVAPIAGLAGCLPGIALAHWWFGQLQDKGAIPEPVRLQVSWIPLVAAVGAGVLASVFAGLLAARRPAKIKPGQALSEASVERFNPGIIRTVLGAAALVGGIVLASIAAKESGEDAANAALGVVMLFMLAVSLLGPLISRACSWLIGLPLRTGGASAHLAAANTRANSRRLASAITPITLAMAFSSTLVFMHTSEDHAMADQRRAGIVADHIVTSPGGLSADTTARAARTKGVDTAVGLLRTGALVPVGSGDSRYLLSSSAQGISGTGNDLRAVQDLDFRAGDPAAIGRPGTVAVDALLAESAKVDVGDRLHMALPDGSAARPKVVAIYGRGLGVAQLTLPRAAVAAHVTAAYDNDVLIKDAPGSDPDKVAAALAPLGDVTDRDGYAAAQDKDREISAWANTTMAAVLGGFAAIAAANTLIMTVLDRRRELSTLRLIGSTRRQILGMVRWEALLVGVAGIVLGTAIALITLNPMMHGITGSAPHVPPGLYAAFAGATLLLGLVSTTLPARLALRTAGLGGAGEKQ